MPGLNRRAFAGLMLAWRSARTAGPLRLRLCAEQAASLLAGGRWWELKSLRAPLGAEARALGYDFGPDRRDPEYAVLAAEAGRCRRMLVRLRLSMPALPAVLVAFDLLPPAAVGAEWSLEGERRELSSSAVPCPRGALLHVVHRAGAGGAVLDSAPIDAVEMAGVRVADRAVVFFAESTTSRSAVSFRVDGAPALKLLVVGLAPGTWEIWHNGFLVDPQGAVEPEAGALYFAGPPGGYFLRPLS